MPGDGCIAFAEIFAELARHDYTGWLVVEAEQNPALADPLEYAMKARRYIREISGL
ncbi:Inosose dehydratase [compost metagenome]